MTDTELISPACTLAANLPFDLQTFFLHADIIFVLLLPFVASMFGRATRKQPWLCRQAQSSVLQVPASGPSRLACFMELIQLPLQLEGSCLRPSAS